VLGVHRCLDPRSRKMTVDDLEHRDTTLQLAARLTVVAILTATISACSSIAQDRLRNSDAYMALDAGEYSKARSLLEPMLAKSPRNPILEYYLAFADQKFGRGDLAAGLYRAILKDGQNVVPRWPVTPEDEGQALQAIACKHLKMTIKYGKPC